MRVYLIFQVLQFGLQMLVFQFFQHFFVPEGLEKQLDCNIKSDHQKSYHKMNKIADSERRKRIRSRLRKATWSLGLFQIRLHRSKLIPMDRLFFTSSLSHFYKLISPVLFTIAILIMNLLMPDLPRKPFHRRSRSDQARNSNQKNHRNNIGPISLSEKKIRN